MGGASEWLVLLGSDQKIKDSNLEICPILIIVVGAVTDGGKETPQM